MPGSLELTYTAVVLAVFADQICLPIPSVLFLMISDAPFRAARRKR